MLVELHHWISHYERGDPALATHLPFLCNPELVQNVDRIIHGSYRFVGGHERLLPDATRITMKNGQVYEAIETYAEVKRLFAHETAIPDTL